MNSQSRQQRRTYEKWLKKIDPARYKEWKAGAQERGRKIHSENVEKVRQYESDFYEAHQTKMIESLRNEGFSDSEIDEQVEDWTKTIRVWGSNEPPKRRRDIRREKTSVVDKIISNEELDGE
jgi:hypothetical protein